MSYRDPFILPARLLAALIAQVQGKLNSSKPVTPKDLDAVFNDKFFSGTGDPFAKLEQVQKQMNESQGPGREKFEDLYQKWASERLDARVIFQKAKTGTNVEASK